MDKITRNELVKVILEDFDEEEVDEEIIHLILEKKVSSHGKRETENTVGQRAADCIAKFAGSWIFIIIFCLTIVIWMIVNVYLLNCPYDPYPFILLNLVLSCLASIQAPLILMSQNLAADKDRQRAEDDYKVNLKTEIIIEDLHQKIDELLENQKKLMEMMDK